MKGKARWRDPVLVKWTYRKNGKKQAVRVVHLHPNMVRAGRQE